MDYSQGEYFAQSKFCRFFYLIKKKVSIKRKQRKKARKINNCKKTYQEQNSYAIFSIFLEQINFQKSKKFIFQTFYRNSNFHFLIKP